MSSQGWEVVSQTPIVDWGDLAAWVQAIGSVAAIWFAGRFSHRDRLRRSADQMQAVHGLANAAKLVRAGALAFNQAVVGDNSQIDQFATANFTDIDQLLLAIPVLEIGGLEAPEVLIALRNDVRLMHSYVVHQANRDAGPDADVFHGSQRLADQAEAIADRIGGWAAEAEARARRWWR